MVSRRNSASSTASQDGSALAYDQWHGVLDEDQAQREARVQRERKEKAERSQYKNVPSRDEQKRRRDAAGKKGQA